MSATVSEKERYRNVGIYFPEDITSPEFSHQSYSFKYSIWINLQQRI